MPNELKLYIILFVIAFLLLGLFILSLSILHSKKALSHKKERELLQQQYESLLLQSQIEIQEQTMQQISRELHDNLGQIASLVKIHLNTIEPSNPKQVEYKVSEAKGLLISLIQDLKNLSRALNGHHLHQYGFESALREEIEKINKTGVFNAVFKSSGESNDIEKDKAIILFRMVQEILNNTIKHSMAENIVLSFSSNKNFITLDISDDGIGFDKILVKGNGSGLNNLYSRAEQINAVLTIDSHPGNGTAICIKLPL